ncbi:MAG: hypothetical protein L6V85_04070 [Clostridiales bacterium]|nr:MAG: hypothetical protein L6V85_04070 [Clostridiales bacterium]
MKNFTQKNGTIVDGSGGKTVRVGRSYRKTTKSRKSQKTSTPRAPKLSTARA